MVSTFASLLFDIRIESQRWLGKLHVFAGVFGLGNTTVAFLYQQQHLGSINLHGQRIKDQTEGRRSLQKLATYFLEV